MKKHLLALLLIPTLLLCGCNSKPSGEGGKEPDPVIPEGPKATSITVSGLTKTTYVQGEELSVEGGKVTVKYDDDSTKVENLTLDMIPNKPNMNEVGDGIAVTVSYLGLTTRFYIDIKPSAPVKQTPTIYLYNSEHISLTDGYVFNYGEAIDVVVEVPTGVNYSISYYQGETAINGVPTEVGSYSLKVLTVENDEYLSGSATLNFSIKVIPTLTIKVNGVAMEGGETYYLNEELPVFTVDCSVSGITPRLYFSKDSEGETIDLGSTLPSEPGSYAVNAEVVASETVQRVHVYKIFKLEAVRKDSPVITFSVNGTALDFLAREHHWAGPGYADSEYYPDEVPEITYTVEPSVQYEVKYELNDVAINTLPNPLTAGTYKIEIVTIENDQYKSVSDYILFRVKERDSRVDPVITFFVNGSKLDIAGNEHHWIGAGYAGSEYYPDELPTVTWEVTPEGTPFTVKYEFKAADAPSSASGSEIAELPNPLVAGTYTIKVNVAKSETVNAKSEYVLFRIKERNQKVDPTIKFYRDGAYIDIKKNGNHWIAGGYLNSQYEPDNVPTITWDVLPEEAQFQVEYAFKPAGAPENADGNKIAALPDVYESGTYTIKIIVAASDTVNALSDYVLFGVK